MVVRLRLSPHRLCPTSKDKVYHIVAMNGPRARDGAPLETVGIYDAIPRRIPDVPKHERSLLDEGKKLARQFVKRIEWDRERVKYWIGTGAQPTKRVAWLLQKENLSEKLLCLAEPSGVAADSGAAVPAGRSFHGYKGPTKPKTAIEARQPKSTPATSAAEATTTTAEAAPSTTP